MDISNFKEGWSRRRNNSVLTRPAKVALILGLIVSFAGVVHWLYKSPITSNTKFPEAAGITQPENAHPVVTAPAAMQLPGGNQHTVDSRVPRPTLAPETPLNLHLTGIVVPGNHNAGFAIIRRPDQQERHFRVGDSVYGYATLEEIHSDRVILVRDGHHQTLHLPTEFMAHDTVSGRARKLEAKRILSDFRSKLVDRDGMALIRMFGFEETYRNGGFMGFTVRIAGEEGGRMLEILGVEEGDVVTAVNGLRFSEGLEAIQSLSALKDATEVNVEIDRQGVPMFFHFELDQKRETTDEGAHAVDPAL